MSKSAKKVSLKNTLIEKVVPKPKLKKKSQIVTALKHLEPGDRFEFIYLKNEFKDTFVIRVGTGSVSIGGEIKDKVNGVVAWKKLREGYTVSQNCEVRIV